jgi:hypothetical protein
MRIDRVVIKRAYLLYVPKRRSIQSIQHRGERYIPTRHSNTMSTARTTFTFEKKTSTVCTVAVGRWGILNASHKFLLLKIKKYLGNCILLFFVVPSLALLLGLLRVFASLVALFCLSSFLIGASGSLVLGAFAMLHLSSWRPLLLFRTFFCLFRLARFLLCNPLLILSLLPFCLENLCLTLFRLFSLLPCLLLLLLRHTRLCPFCCYSWLVPSPHQMAWGTSPPNIGDQHTVTISCKAQPALSHVVQDASMFLKDRTWGGRFILVQGLHLYWSLITYDWDMQITPPSFFGISR